MRGGARGKAQARVVTGAAAKAGAAKRSAPSATDDAAAEVAAAEGMEAEARAAPPAKTPRPPAKAAPTPAEPTSRQKAVEQTKDKEIFKALQEECKKLADKLKQAEMEKAQLAQAAQRAKSARRASQDQTPAKSNAKRRNEKVCFEPVHIDRNILSSDAVWQPGCISPSGNPAITTQLVYYLTTLFFSFDI